MQQQDLTSGVWRFCFACHPWLFPSLRWPSSVSSFFKCRLPHCAQQFLWNISGIHIGNYGYRGNHLESYQTITHTYERGVRWYVPHDDAIMKVCIGWGSGRVPRWSRCLHWLGEGRGVKPGFACCARLLSPVTLNISIGSMPTEYLWPLTMFWWINFSTNEWT